MGTDSSSYAADSSHPTARFNQRVLAVKPDKAAYNNSISGQIIAGNSVARLPMSSEPPDASGDFPELSGFGDHLFLYCFGSFPAGSYSPSKSYDTASATTTDTFEEALRNNPFAFAMQQSLQDVVRHFVKALPFPERSGPPWFDAGLELVKIMMVTVSKQPGMRACPVNAPIFWSEGDATAVG
jgi:hypothetical protein